MDDSQFDDIIKKGVGEYQEPGFDPAALAGLHYRMASSSQWPWYSSYRTELMVGAGLVLCTLIILWSQWLLSSKEQMLLMDNLSSSKNQAEQVANLQEEIRLIRSLQPDTVRIIEVREQNSLSYKTLLNRIAGLEATLENYIGIPIKGAPYPNSEPPVAEMATAGDLEKGNDVTGDNPAQVAVNPHRLVPNAMERKSVRAVWNVSDTAFDARANALSVKAIRDIEDHYQKGIGIRVGPTIEISKGMYSIGNGRLGLTGGLLAEFILSPSVSVETGGKYLRRIYKVSDPEVLKKMPDVEESIGTPKSADIDSWILEIPFNLKYRYPTSVKSHWLAGVGFSSMVFTRQVLEYDYEYPDNPSASIYSLHEKGKPRLYAGTLNFSWGLSNELKTKNILETSLYYQVGLGSLGVERSKQSFLGVRTVYWFKVR